jgi:hypothetical protein
MNKIKKIAVASLTVLIPLLIAYILSLIKMTNKAYYQPRTNVLTLL